MKGKVVMQMVLQQARKSHAEEERIDMLARRFVLTGLMLCAMVASSAWLSTLIAA